MRNIKKNKSCPGQAALVVYNTNIIDIKIPSENWALSEGSPTFVYIYPVSRQIVRIVNHLVYRISFRPDLPRRKPRVCGDYRFA